jgi:DNA-binding NtrC family response regulator
MPSMTRVALFSQDLKLHTLLAPALGREFELLAESRPDCLSQTLHARAFDVLLVDIDPENFTTAAYTDILSHLSDTGVTTALMVDDLGREAAIELLQHGAHGLCRKPPAMRELKAVLRGAAEHTHMKRELQGRKPQHAPLMEPEVVGCDALIGASAPMRTVYDLIHRVARLNASVLITGESGTGKELIARAIHNQGDRKHQPFVAVSCGAIPETLIESELFGHEKGAFTGTTGTRTGYFEQAGGGTLFLDEIGELSPQTQVKLLRVLQQKEFSRLGSGKAIPLKARVLFATHRNIPCMIEEGRFRLDLYYRINVMTIHSPSLAERPEDIRILARHFLTQYSETYEKFVAEVSPAALAALEEYEWPGNVRELENVIQSAIICADGDEIEVKDLPERLRSVAAETEGLEDVPQAGTFERLLRDYKVKLAIKAIEDNRGNKTLAARSLDISRAYLHRLIRQGEVEAISAA